MYRRFHSLTGFVLAGGASRRMGRPKAMLVLNGEAMLLRQMRRLGSVASRVAVVGSRPEYAIAFAVPFLTDELPGRGPLAGIYTGLLRTHTEHNLFLGCDLPLVNPRLLSFLARRAIESSADVTIPQSHDGRLQPLCAVYRRRVRPAVRAALARGENKVMSFFSRVRCQVIPWRDFARAGFPPSIFANMNTFEDYRAARRRIEPPRAVPV